MDYRDKGQAAGRSRSWGMAKPRLSRQWQKMVDRMGRGAWTQSQRSLAWLLLLLSLGVSGIVLSGKGVGAESMASLAARWLTGGGALQSATITMEETVSDCYYYNGQSLSTISVEVAWTGLSNGDQILVTLTDANGSTSRTITQQSTQGPLPGVGATVSPILTPQVVAFDIPATFSGTLTATGPGAVAATPISITRTASCAPQVCTGNVLGGMVYVDYNRDGTKQGGEIAGVGGVMVKAFDRWGGTYMASTNAAGIYCINVPTEKYPLRVEFSSIPAFYAGGTSTIFGPDSMSTVQFVAAPDQTVDLGVVDPQDYCQLDPMVFAPCYVVNDPIAPGSPAASMPVMVRFPYSSSGLPGANGVEEFATAGEVGSVWAVAYHRQKKYIFVGSTLRRHSGYGPKGLGGIYILDPFGANTTGNVLDSWNVESDLNIAVQDPASPIGGSLDPLQANAGRGLSGVDAAAKNADPDAFDTIGKVGIGGLGIDDEGLTLFFVNQFDKKLYLVDITDYDPNDPTTAPDSSKVTSTPIPSLTCTGGAWRPAGVKVRKGVAYVSGVCDAQSSQSISDMRAGVFAYNLTTKTWRTIFDFPLTYPKGASASIRGWKPWQSTFSSLLALSGGGSIQAAQPMFTDLAFDVDGAMVLGFNDRSGMQSARDQRDTNGAGNYSGFVGGDLLRAFFSGSAFVLENNAKAGPNGGASPSNYEGPGFGEFYFDNWRGGGHSETFQGGIAIRPGSGEVISSAMDPIDASIWATGVRINSNLTGQAVRGVAIYTNTMQDGSRYIGKSTGLGDVELGCDLGGDIELGNRIWFDMNGNGRQDPHEVGVGTDMQQQYRFNLNVQVELYKDNVKVGQTTATPDGYFKFNASNVNLNGAAGLEPLTDYEIRIPMGQMSENGNNLLELSPKNSDSRDGGHLRDSDAELIDDNAVVKVKTGGPGDVNHTVDVGFMRLVMRIEISQIGKDINDTINEASAQQGGNGLSRASSGTGEMTQLSLGGNVFTPICLTPGGLVEAMVTVKNPTRVYTAPDVPGPEFVLDLPQSISAMYSPRSSTTMSGNGVVQKVSRTRLEWDGQLLPQDTLTIKYFVQAGDYDPGTILCADAILNYDGDLDGVHDSSDQKEVCTRLSCPPLGPGSYPQSVTMTSYQNTPVSGQRMGSVLIYNAYTSSANPSTQNSRLTLTNVHPVLDVNVHLFFIDGETCAVADWYVKLTANQTTNYLLSDLDPGISGYIVAVAVDREGCPISFNYLIGDVFVKYESGHTANLPALGVSALLAGLLQVPCDPTQVTTELRFDGISYNEMPRTLAVSNLPTRAEGNDTMLILNRIGGNLGTGVSRMGTIFGLLYDDIETSASFTMNLMKCQERGILSNVYPRTAPRYDAMIPAGRTGWMKIFGGTDYAMTGAVINNSVGRFNNGHNLHVLTITDTAVFTMPVFPM
jgi:hypothetical protein